MGTAIDTLGHALEASKELSAVYLMQRDNKVLEVETLRNQALNTKAIQDQKIKAIKRQKLKVTLIAVGEAILLVIMVI